MGFDIWELQKMIYGACGQVVVCCFAELSKFHHLFLNLNRLYQGMVAYMYLMKRKLMSAIYPRCLYQIWYSVMLYVRYLCTTF